MISTRSIAAAGIVLMSVTPEAFDGVERRPSTIVYWAVKDARVDGRR